MKKMFVATVEKVGVDEFRALLPERVLLSDEDLLKAKCSQIGLIRPVFVGALYKGLLEKRGITGAVALKYWVEKRRCLSDESVSDMIDYVNNAQA